MIAASIATNAAIITSATESAESPHGRRLHFSPERLRAVVDGLAMSRAVPGSVPGERENNGANDQNQEASEQSPAHANLDNVPKIG